MLRHAYKSYCPLQYSCLGSHHSHQCPSARHDAAAVGGMSPQRNRHGASRDTERRMVQWVAACLGACLAKHSLLSPPANNPAHPWSWHLVVASQPAHCHRAGIAGYVRRAGRRICLWLSSIFHTYCKPGFPRRIFVALYLAQTYRISLSTASLTGARPSASHHSLPSFAAVSNALAGLHPRRCAA